MLHGKLTLSVEEESKGWALIACPLFVSLPSKM
nr:MAG TPA: hypothetical protein [Caudoviricetes sp.]